MVAYKLMRKRRDGSLGPLFINRKMRVPVGEWVDAESHPTRGFALRPGWHCTLTPYAPHLAHTSDRVWVKCQVRGATKYLRPESQGGTWLLARQIKVLGEYTNA